MGAHEGLDLLILLLRQHPFHHVKVAVHGVLHQNQVGGQPFLHSAFGVLADPLEVITSLPEKNQEVKVQNLLQTVHSSIRLVRVVVHLIRHRHAPERLDGCKLHRQCGCRLPHALDQGILYGGVNSLQDVSHVTSNL